MIAGVGDRKTDERAHPFTKLRCGRLSRCVRCMRVGVRNLTLQGISERSRLFEGGPNGGRVLGIRRGHMTLWSLRKQTKKLFENMIDDARYKVRLVTLVKQENDPALVSDPRAPGTRTFHEYP